MVVTARPQGVVDVRDRGEEVVGGVIDVDFDSPARARLEVAFGVNGDAAGVV